MAKWVLAAFVAIVLLLAVSLGATYNGLVRQDQAVQAQWAQVENAYQRRADLVPNLVATVKGAAQFERETLEAVTAARNTARAAADRAKQAPADGALIGALAAADGVLGGALARLMAVAEAYPDLKADQTMRDLGEELTHTENRVAFARQAFNDAVLDHNNAVQHFPSAIVARVTGFRPAAMLEATTSDEERRAPRVQF